ncbi:MAG: ABC transporter ATP-binding protein [Proteobacteria bacterium]|nr:ABC transporter ATP-binding protein [Pseudomonadota bacterium]
MNIAVITKYKANKALKNISLTISAGDSIAIIGPNGSGKSTLLKIINGIILPTDGEYIFKDIKITEDKLKDPYFSKSFHKSIGFVFQNSDTQLFCPSVYEEIAFGPIQMGMGAREVDYRVLDCLKLLGIEHLKTRAPYNLSEGEKKKVAIASVIALNPEILVFDEPLSGLDPKTKRFLKNFILEINKTGKTIICATHDFEDIRELFYRVLVLSEDNRAIFVGDYGTVINDEDFLIQNNLK